MKTVVEINNNYPLISIIGKVDDVIVIKVDNVNIDKKFKVGSTIALPVDIDKAREYSRCMNKVLDLVKEYEVENVENN